MNERANHKPNSGKTTGKVVVFLGDPAATGPEAIANRAISEAYAELAALEHRLLKLLGPELYRLVSP